MAPGTEMIGIDDDDNRYIEDADLRDLLGSDEDGAQYDDIYPKRTGVVTALGADTTRSMTILWTLILLNQMGMN